MSKNPPQHMQNYELKKQYKAENRFISFSLNRYHLLAITSPTIEQIRVRSEGQLLTKYRHQSLR